VSRRDELLALAERAEALDGPDRGVDADIELAIGNWSPEHHEAWNRYQECGERDNPPFTAPCPPRHFTHSLDAALSLVPEGMRATISTHSPAAACIGPSQSQAWTYAVTPALALTAAALRALAEQEQ